jgi:hypothetical protein
VSRATIFRDVHQEAALQELLSPGNPVVLGHVVGAKPLQDVDEDGLSPDLVGVFSPPMISLIVFAGPVEPSARARHVVGADRDHIACCRNDNGTHLPREISRTKRSAEREKHRVFVGRRRLERATEHQLEETFELGFLEKQGILAALEVTGGNKAQAAAILEIDRSTLYKKLKDYDIDS